MKKEVHKLIGIGKKPFIIAELSANHNGNLKRAKEIMLAAKNGGADAVKIQTYTADSMTIDSEKNDFKIKHGLWKNNNLYNLYKSAETPFSWQKDLFDYAKKIDIIIFSTPFDEKGVDLLEKLKTPFYKVASFEITDLSLISYIATKGKPMFLSTGMSNENEIGEALEVARSFGANEIILFHCISSYPALLKESNLNMILTLRKKFNTLVGLSDHTIGLEAALIATGLGVVAIEKHFTLDRREKGPDSSFSMNPTEMKKLVIKTKEAWQGMGKGQFERTEQEKKNKIFRRSLYFVKSIRKGGLVTKNHIRVIRPGFGIEPKFYNQIIGKRTKIDIQKGDRVSWEVLE